MIKLRPLDRFLLAFSLLVLAFLCVVGFLTGIGLLASPVRELFDLCMQTWYNRLGLCLISAVFFLCVLYTLRSVSKPSAPENEQTVLLLSSDGGQIRMSLAALDTLIQKSVRGNSAVRESKSTETIGENGEVSIALRLSLAQDAVVPQVCSSVQSSVREYVQQKAGLQVARIEILVSQVGTAGMTRVE